MFFRRKIALYLLKLSDVAIFLIGLLISTWSTTDKILLTSFEKILTMRISIINLLVLTGMVCIWHFIFKFFNCYSSRRLEGILQEWEDILKATTVGTLAVFISGKLFGILLFTSGFCLLFWLFATITILLLRTLLRFFLRQLRLNDRNLRFVVIVGTNKRAYDFEDLITRHKELGFRLRGYIDDQVYQPKEHIDILGKLADFQHILRTVVVDEIVIALPIKSYYEQIQSIIDIAKDQGIIVRYLPPLFDSISSVRLSLSGGAPVLEFANGIAQEDWRLLVKRAFDFLLAFVLLIMTSPVLLICAIAVKFSSPGPIIFSQDRVGYNKRIFRLYKFRTMIKDAEKIQTTLEVQNQMAGPVFKMENDPRVTPVGKWLRKTSLDELPQLLNVIKGDMSLVGPRPLPVRDFNGFDQDWQRRRFSVRPGITCLWQINGRNNVQFEKWMKLDMQYIDQWTLVLDFVILLKTIPAVLKGTGAK